VTAEKIAALADEIELKIQAGKCRKPYKLPYKLQYKPYKLLYELRSRKHMTRYLRMY
jgi:hypothetical protein